jgi:hypothetical protein
MDVDLPTLPIDVDEALRGGAVHKLVPELREQLDDALRVPELDEEIEVVVLARFFSQQGIDAPAAVEPDVDALALEPVNDTEECGRVHRSARMSTPVGPPSHSD